MDKNIELIVSLTSLSRWYDSGAGEGGGSFSTNLPISIEKSGRGVSTDKTNADVSPARGLGSRQRTSNFDLLPQTPGPPDGNLAESKDYFFPINKYHVINSVVKRGCTSTGFTYCRDLFLEITFIGTTYSPSSYNSY